MINGYCSVVGNELEASGTLCRRFFPFFQEIVSSSYVDSVLMPDSRFLRAPQRMRGEWYKGTMNQGVQLSTYNKYDIPPQCRKSDARRTKKARAPVSHLMEFGIKGITFIAKVNEGT